MPYLGSFKPKLKKTIQIFKISTFEFVKKESIMFSRGNFT